MEYKVILFGSNMERMELNHFMTILLLDPYFKINGWIYRGILKVLVKKFIKSNFIPTNFSQFRGEWKFEILRKWRWMSIHSYPFHYLPLKFPNKGIDFLFPSLKLLNRWENFSYLNTFHFVPFLSLAIYPYSFFSF